MIIEPIYFDTTESDLKYKQHRKNNIDSMTSSNPIISKEMILKIINQVDNFGCVIETIVGEINDEDDKAHLLEDISSLVKFDLFTNIMGYDPFE